MIPINNNLLPRRYAGPSDPGSDSSLGHASLQTPSSTMTGTGAPHTQSLYRPDQNAAARVRAGADAARAATHVAIQELTITDEAEIHVIRDEITGQLAVAKIGTDDSMNHELSIYRRIGAHPNLNPITGIGIVRLDGEEKRGLVMAKKDLDGDDVREFLNSGEISDAQRFNLILPYIARALYDFAAHAASRGISHRDLDPSNVLFSVDSVEVAVTDLELASVEAERPQASWKLAEVQIENPATNLYPVDALGIANTLRMFAGFIDEYGENIESTLRGPETLALKRFLSRLDPSSSQEPEQIKQPSDFDFLAMGNNNQDQVRELLQQISSMSGKN